MGWNLLGCPKIQLVTKSLAEQFAKMEAPPHDRTLSPRRLQVYEKLWKANQFRPITWATAICRETDGLYRINGKHTSILLRDLPELPEFYVTIEEYECDMLEDVAKLYSTFDSAMQTRNAHDIYASFTGTVPELAVLSRRHINCAIQGLAYAKFGQDLYGKTQPAERAELILNCPEFGIWFCELIAGAPVATQSGYRSSLKCGHLIRMVVAAAMYSTWSKVKGPATEFWSAVRDESGTSPNTPDRKLARFLVTTGMRASNNKDSKFKQAGNREVYVKCLHAWNAWRKDESTSLNYYADKSIPGIH